MKLVTGLLLATLTIALPLSSFAAGGAPVKCYAKNLTDSESFNLPAIKLVSASTSDAKVLKVQIKDFTFAAIYRKGTTTMNIIKDDAQNASVPVSLVLSDIAKNGKASVWYTEMNSVVPTAILTCEF